MSHPLYTELVLEHHQRPRHFGEIQNTPTHSAIGQNPNCGDLVSIQMDVAEGQVRQLKWLGQGCALCMASASMMAEWVNREQPTVSQSVQRSLDVRAFLRGEHDGSALGKYQTFSSICKHPSRVKCAALGWTALADALVDA